MNRRSWCRGAAAVLAWPSVTLRASAPELVVGQVGPFTGIPVPDAPQINQGAKACFALVNRQGGVNGRRISFFEIDDTYTVEGFEKAFRAALQRRPLALLSPVGSVTIKPAMDSRLFDTADVVVLNVVPGAEVLRDPGHPRIFHIRAGDRQQIEKIVQHVKTLTLSRLAVVHQDIPVGRSGLEMARATADRLGGMTLLPSMATDQQDSLAQAARHVAATDAQATLVVGAPWFMAGGVAHLRRAGVGHFLFTLSYVTPDMLLKAAGPASRGVGLAQVFPNPMGVTLPLQREFQAAMRASFPEVAHFTPLHFEGYITAKTFVEAARRAREASPGGIAHALRTIGEIDLGGHRLNFAQGNAGGRYVDIGVMSFDGRLLY